MKHITFILMLCLSLSLTAQKRVYLNAGHGSWGPDDRPMPTIPYPMLESTGRPDTCGFYESNTNLWKVLHCGTYLKETGDYKIRYSRTKNGPFPYVAGASNATRYNRELSVIAAEVDSWGTDLFLSVHSNAASEGSTANYPLFLYRGLDSENAVPRSRAMCEAIWPYHVEAMKAGFEPMSYYQTSMNIRGDRSFYNYTWQNDKGYYGYLGVLMHGCPGFLAEGYFHTYQPSRHRALNQDWCCMEGRRYARGIISYFGTKSDPHGCIMGAVRTKSKTTDNLPIYTYASGTDDQYMPLNGATVRLKNSKREVIDIYQVDNNYNGIFVFWDLLPGTYYVDLYCPGYATQQSATSTTKFTVKANETAYKTFYMITGSTKDLIGPTTPTGISDITPDADEEDLAERQNVRIYDTTGKLVLTTTRNRIDSEPLPAGVYVMQSNGQSVKYSRR